MTYFQFLHQLKYIIVADISLRTPMIITASTQEEVNQPKFAVRITTPPDCHHVKVSLVGLIGCEVYATLKYSSGFLMPYV